MARIISIFNQKGGVGKTTSVVNIASALGKLGKKVLVVDIDPQGNATSGLGVDKNSHKTIYSLLLNSNFEDGYLKETSSKNVSLIPANSELAGTEVELVNLEDRELRLKNALEKFENDFDYILIDPPPSLGQLSINALVASDSIIIPIQAEYYALEGVSELVKTYNLVKDTLNKDLEIEGVLISMFDGRNNLALEVLEEVKKYFKSKVFKTSIPRNIRVAEAPSYGLSVIDYDENSKGAKAYMKIAKEIVRNNKRWFSGKKNGLGKGLGALISSEDIEREKKDSIEKIDLDTIRANKDQPRKEFDEEKIKELAESIKSHGIIQPLILRKKDGYYEIVAGERRFRAAKLVQLEKVPAIVVDIDDDKANVLSIIENIQREDLNAVEEASSYKSLLERYKITQEELSKKDWKIKVLYNKYN